MANRTRTQVPDTELEGTHEVLLPRWAAERLAILHDAFPGDTFIPIMVDPTEMHIDLEDGSTMVHRFSDPVDIVRKLDGTSEVNIQFERIAPED